MPENRPKKSLIYFHLIIELMVTPDSVFKGGCGAQKDDPVQAVLLLRCHPRLAGLHQHGLRHGRPGGQANPKETHRTTHWILLPVHRHAPHSVWIGIHFLRQRPHEVGQEYIIFVSSFICKDILS